MDGLLLDLPAPEHVAPFVPPVNGMGQPQARRGRGFQRVGSGDGGGGKSAIIREGERLRTLELDELAPLRLRLSIPF